MGVNIHDIAPGTKISLEELKSRIIAIDAYNTLYQFLSSIRQPDGTPLMDSKQRITSHLSGLFYRTANLLEIGIRPVYVFDGKPHPLKWATIEERVAVKEKARKEYEKAIAEGDMETARSKAQQTSRLTKDMVQGGKKLLDYLGVPYIEAPSEGEAQASAMVIDGNAHAVASQDFDSLLFGAPLLVRNCTMTGRRKLPRRNVYITVVPEITRLKDTLDALEITREQLVDLGILVGTDFNPGVKGVGPKTALKHIRKFGTIEKIIDEKGIEIAEDIDVIRSIFLEPDVTVDYEIEFGTVSAEDVVGLLCNEHDFSEDRVNSVLKKLDSVVTSKSQTSLDKWF
jgi:flap endonuclease-1